MKSQLVGVIFMQATEVRRIDVAYRSISWQYKALRLLSVFGHMPRAFWLATKPYRSKPRLKARYAGEGKYPFLRLANWKIGKKLLANRGQSFQLSFLLIDVLYEHLSLT
jgi:hypothetical protein